ncbi:Protein of avirulence locus ImpE [hydrothermal vent metagenome]|uniref:Protein of avirulence locus ImpE n=1 Tax=hydrothermal vent metagenome TaxID=652676 RepID=A0A3B0YVS8_9ZZZZ
MDNALQSLQNGDLDGTLTQIKERVRSDPASAKERIFLFQLLAVMGDWNRALVQLNVVGDLDDSALAMVQTYREALNCELLRCDVFEGKQSPLIFGEPEQWIAELVEAFKLVAEGHHDRSQQLRQKAFDAAPATTGEINGEAFSWIADADSRFGPVLEVIVNGRYYWVPFKRISRIQMEAPCDLRDTVWMPAYFTWANGGESAALIPTRYFGSENSVDSQVILSKKTDWLDGGNDLYFGQGQRLLITDVGEFSLMDIRDITLSCNG